MRGCLIVKLDAAMADPAARGIILDVDSPGGEAAGCFDLARHIRAANAVKPVWAIVDEEANSGAHEHGHAALNIAVEGKRVAMEFRAPGMDVVGFEHEAATDADKAAVRRAEAALKDPLALFVLPSAAGCKVATAKVGLEDEEEHEAGHVEGERHVRGEAAVEEGEHTEFHAEYALDCADPGRIDAITFAFLEMFPGAEEIEVTLLTERGQTSYEVERDRPRLAIGGSS